MDYGFGGAIANTEGSLNITSSIFSHNKAIGGNNSTATADRHCRRSGVRRGVLFTMSLGATATLSGCTFDHNQAQGGNGDTGSGAGGPGRRRPGRRDLAGYGGDLLWPEHAHRQQQHLTQNDAQGGDNNTGTASVSGLVGTGVGAGIANYAGGTATVSGSVLDNDQASGGNHNTAGGAGAVFAGLGAGGGIFNYLGNYNSSVYGSLGVSVVTVSDCVIDLNQAQGGGGNGEGGGIANLLGATTTVDNSLLTLNEANGAGGGAGLGGGAYNDRTSSLALTKDLVTLNEADGAPGIGGGVYTLGTFTDLFTLIVGNHASTSGDNIGP